MIIMEGNQIQGVTKYATGKSNKKLDQVFRKKKIFVKRGEKK